LKCDYGTSYADWMIGGSAAETFVGGAGNDNINGGAGTDRADYGSSTSWNPRQSRHDSQTLNGVVVAAGMVSDGFGGHRYPDFNRAGSGLGLRRLDGGRRKR
jgi:Ca2+-binding RTX toxin-like protein